MMKLKLIGIAVIAAMGLSFAGCDNEKSDNTILLLLMAKARADAQAKATAVSSSVSGSMSSVVAPTGAMTAFNKSMDQQKMMIAILNNGNDPVFAKEAVTEFIARQHIQKAAPRAQLAALTVSGGVLDEGTKTYTFSGTLDGVGQSAPTTLPIPLCGDITITTPSGTQGTMTFGGGSTLTWTGLGGASPDTGAFNGSFTMNSQATYSNFGFFYVNYLVVMKLIQNPTPSNACEAAGSFTNYAIIQSGDVVVGMTADYSGTATTNSFASSSNFEVNLDSPGGLVILSDGTGDPVTVTMDDVSYVYSSNISVADINDLLNIFDPVTGSITVTFTGTVNGNSIDQTITINL